MEGVGESSLPARSLGGFGAYDVRNDVYNRLMESGNDEAVSSPELRALLDVHFNRLPASYGLDINMDKMEDMLLHQKLRSRNLWTKGDDVENQQVLSVSPNAKPPGSVDNNEMLPVLDW